MAKGWNKKKSKEKDKDDPGNEQGNNNHDSTVANNNQQHSNVANKDSKKEDKKKSSKPDNTVLLVDSKYARSKHGIMKVPEVVFDIIAFSICDIATRSFTCEPVIHAVNFFRFVSIASFLTTIPFGLFFLFSLQDRFSAKIPWHIVQIAFPAFWALMYAIASPVLLALHVTKGCGQGQDAYIAAAVFGFLAMIAYIIDAIMVFLDWRKTKKQAALKTSTTNGPNLTPAVIEEGSFEGRVTGPGTSERDLRDTPDVEPYNVHHPQYDNPGYIPDVKVPGADVKMVPIHDNDNEEPTRSKLYVITKDAVLETPSADANMPKVDMHVENEPKQQRGCSQRDTPDFVEPQLKISKGDKEEIEITAPDLRIQTQDDKWKSVPQRKDEKAVKVTRKVSDGGSSIGSIKEYMYSVRGDQDELNKETTPNFQLTTVKPDAAYIVDEPQLRPLKREVKYVEEKREPPNIDSTYEYDMNYTQDDEGPSIQDFIMDKIKDMDFEEKTELSETLSRENSRPSTPILGSPNKEFVIEEIHFEPPSSPSGQDFHTNKFKEQNWRLKSLEIPINDNDDLPLQLPNQQSTIVINGSDTSPVKPMSVERQIPLQTTKNDPQILILEGFDGKPLVVRRDQLDEYPYSLLYAQQYGTPKQPEKQNVEIDRNDEVLEVTDGDMTEFNMPPLSFRRRRYSISSDEDEKKAQKAEGMNKDTSIVLDVTDGDMKEFNKPSLSFRRRSHSISSDEDEKKVPKETKNITIEHESIKIKPSIDTPEEQKIEIKPTVPEVQDMTTPHVKVDTQVGTTKLQASEPENKNKTKKKAGPKRKSQHEKIVDNKYVTDINTRSLSPTRLPVMEPDGRIAQQTYSKGTKTTKVPISIVPKEEVDKAKASEIIVSEERLTIESSKRKDSQSSKESKSSTESTKEVAFEQEISDTKLKPIEIRKNGSDKNPKLEKVVEIKTVSDVNLRSLSPTRQTSRDATTEKRTSDIIYKDDLHLNQYTSGDNADKTERKSQEIEKETRKGEFDVNVTIPSVDLSIGSLSEDPSVTKQPKIPQVEETVTKTTSVTEKDDDAKRKEEKPKKPPKEPQIEKIVETKTVSDINVRSFSPTRQHSREQRNETIQRQRFTKDNFHIDQFSNVNMQSPTKEQRKDSTTSEQSKQSKDNQKDGMATEVMGLQEIEEQSSTFHIEKPQADIQDSVSDTSDREKHEIPKPQKSVTKSDHKEKNSKSKKHKKEKQEEKIVETKTVSDINVRSFSPTRQPSTEVKNETIHQKGVTKDNFHIDQFTTSQSVEQKEKPVKDSTQSKGMKFKTSINITDVDKSLEAPSLKLKTKTPEVPQAEAVTFKTPTVKDLKVKTPKPDVDVKVETKAPQGEEIKFEAPTVKELNLEKPKTDIDVKVKAKVPQTEAVVFDRPTVKDITVRKPKADVDFKLKGKAPQAGGIKFESPTVNEFALDKPKADVDFKLKGKAPQAEGIKFESPTVKEFALDKPKADVDFKLKGKAPQAEGIKFESPTVNEFALDKPKADADFKLKGKAPQVEGIKFESPTVEEFAIDKPKADVDFKLKGKAPQAEGIKFESPTVKEFALDKPKADVDFKLKGKAPQAEGIKFESPTVNEFALDKPKADVDFKLKGKAPQAEGIKFESPTVNEFALDKPKADVDIKLQSPNLPQTEKVGSQSFTVKEVSLEPSASAKSKRVKSKEKQIEKIVETKTVSDVNSRALSPGRQISYHEPREIQKSGSLIEDKRHIDQFTDVASIQPKFERESRRDSFEKRGKNMKKGKTGAYDVTSVDPETEQVQMRHPEKQKIRKENQEEQIKEIKRVSDTKSKSLSPTRGSVQRDPETIIQFTGEKPPAFEQPVTLTKFRITSNEGASTDPVHIRPPIISQPHETITTIGDREKSENKNEKRAPKTSDDSDKKDRKSKKEKRASQTERIIETKTVSDINRRSFSPTRQTRPQDSIEYIKGDTIVRDNHIAQFDTSEGESPRVKGKSNLKAPKSSVKSEIRVNINDKENEGGKFDTAIRPITPTGIASEQLSFGLRPLDSSTTDQPSNTFPSESKDIVMAVPYSDHSDTTRRTFTSETITETINDERRQQTKEVRVLEGESDDVSWNEMPVDVPRSQNAPISYRTEISPGKGEMSSIASDDSSDSATRRYRMETASPTAFLPSSTPPKRLSSGGDEWEVVSYMYGVSTSPSVNL
ncbi:unnamed protein product [Owenia fusiformis]|uniref:MARVEL domain-containing protein n=1 Tax=Owenia fusiformis TaxID=6347 RepID=A0A8S4NDW9_OWEFU|nr:unnamed protein product [Owenia fusiformis]